MLERLAGNEYYCFMMEFFGYFHNTIGPLVIKKRPHLLVPTERLPTVACLSAYAMHRARSKGVCWPSFTTWLKKTMEVFMDDFSVFGNSFENCLSRLEKMLQRCEDTNLCLNWEKSHFMVKEGIVLGHKISKNGIEVDKAKIDVIAKLPHPTTVKGVRVSLVMRVPRGLPTLQITRGSSDQAMSATARSSRTFSRLATMDPPGDIMVQT
ncbi:hypothetical protein Tco_1252748 [Tanacetum coccineum]|uniref:Reverse transcriptase domain-containing protein n=1 Tax=Tanacetum coccineum TaxID=301880 RepID=A0ABQ5BKF1_9ASTR